MSAPKPVVEEMAESRHKGHRNGFVDRADPMQRTQTLATVSIPADVFEKLYLSPQNVVKGEARETYGNPTPIALVGFLIALTPLACDLMGWRGAGGTGAAGIGAYFFFGGLLQVITGILEWVLGNTFSSVVFSAYGAFFLAFGATLHPAFAASAAYAPAGEAASAGLATQGWNASFGFFMVWMGVLSAVFFICAFRTNVCFVLIFLTLTIGFSFLTGAYWLLADSFNAHASQATNMVTAGGACFFATSIIGWWVFLSIMLATLDFPFQLPVGDLSGFIKPRAARVTKDHEV